MSLPLDHVAEIALILQKLGEWEENLLWVPVTGITYRANSAHDFYKCIPKEMHASMHYAVPVLSPV